MTAVTIDGILFKTQKIKFIQTGNNYDGRSNVGVIKDLIPGAESDSTQSKYPGWEYKPANHKFLTGSSFKYAPDRIWQSQSMSISYPCQATFNNLTSKTRGFDLKRVKIVFSHTNTQQAYRYQYTPGTVNIIYKNLVEVPFRVYESDYTDSTTSDVQINCGVIDTGATSTGGWVPTADSTSGDFQVVIFSSPYDTNKTNYKQETNGTPLNLYIRVTALDIYYVWAPRLINPGGTFVDNDEFWIYPYTICVPYRQGTSYPLYYEFTTAAPVFGDPNTAKQQNALEKIRVVPNPYYGFSSLDRSISDKFVTFRNLPLNCTIKIYTLNGDLVRTLSKTSSGGLSTSSTMEWNLQNTERTPVASGIYVALIDAPGIGTKILKIAIFTEQERVNF